MKVTLRLLFLLIVFICILFSTASTAFAQAQARSYLTLEVLQERVSNPIQTEGKNQIDLSNFTIDLSNTEHEFNQQFYRELNKAISASGTPIGIDLSNSSIVGQFEINRLGIYSTVVEGALPSLFTPLEKEEIQQYYPQQNNSQEDIPRVSIFRGELKLVGTTFDNDLVGDKALFLQPIIATGVKFQNFHLTESVFAAEVDLSNSEIEQNLNLTSDRFLAAVKFNEIAVTGNSDFSQSQFEGLVSGDRSLWSGIGNFSRTVFAETVKFDRALFEDRVLFSKAKFLHNLILTNSIFDKNITFRDIYLNNTIDLKDVHFLDRLDFSNAFFSPQARINGSALAFDSAEAKIIGDRGIGRRINIDRVVGNETVFRNLIRNFRSLEQIGDANYLEYQREQLRAQQWRDRLTKTSWKKVFSWNWLSLFVRWLLLNFLLILGDYGTNINSIFFIGIITIGFFSFFFWLIDRYRPGISQPIIPSRYEIIVMTGSYSILILISEIGLFLATKKPWLTLFGVTIILLPIPLLITTIIYQQGRYHKLIDTSYFVEDGSLREFRLLIGRLPIMPRFPFFRDRFQPILWTKRWSWLNYYDFSVNNIFKLGFNDIRLRDEYLPGLIATLVWYQWCLGVLYIILLLWTLSRTIPGLNLLIYF